MSTEHKLFGSYLGLTARQRIYHLLNNFHCRNYYEEGYRKYIEGTIADIRAYERNRKSELGVRVMSGNSISDITAEGAYEALAISKAVSSGRISESLIKDKEDRRMILLAIDEWVTIRDDCKSLERAINMLNPKDHELIMDYLSGKKSYRDIASDFMIDYESARKRLQRIRGRVVRLALSDFERHCIGGGK